MQTTSYRAPVRSVVVPAILMALLAALLLSACTTPAEGTTAQTDATAEVIIGDLSANATAAGSLTPRRSVALEAPAAARATEVLVRPGQAVTEGQTLLVLDSSAPALDVAAAQLDVRAAKAKLDDMLAEPTDAELASAEAAVASAQAALDSLLAGPTAADLAAAETSLRAAEASVAAASADLTTAENSVSAADLAAAEAALAAARIQLTQAQERNQETTNLETHEALLAAERAAASAQARVDELRGGPDTAAAQSGVGAAAARLESSRADYARQLAGATETQIASAESQLADAQVSLSELKDGPSAAEVQAAEADLESVRLTLTGAEEMLSRMTVVAPFDGVVTAVNVQPGELASGPVVELLDPDSLQVVLQVDEVDVGGLAEGQAATVTLEGFPGVTIAAEIASIAAVSRASDAGAVVYDVRLDLAETDLPLLSGMTADASLVTAEKKDVLLIPNAAVQVNRTNGTYSVQRVMSDETLEEVMITVGLRDSQYTEVTGGISAGDQVRVNDTSVTQSTQGFGAMSASPTPTSSDSAAAVRAEVTVGDLAGEVSAGGEIIARRSASLTIQTGGTVAETPVEAGDVVRAGDTLVQLDTADLERTVAQAAQALISQEAALATLKAAPTAVELAAAEAAVHSAQAQLDDLLDGSSPEEIAAAEANLRAAQADLGAASARLNSVSGSADEAALRAAQIDLDVAQSAATTAAEQHSSILVTEPNQFLDAQTLTQLEEQARAAAQQANADLLAAQEAYDALVNGDPVSASARQASVASAAAQRDSAQAQLDLLLEGASAADIAAARLTLAQAELRLEQLVSGPDEATRTANEVSVEQARIRLQRAERDLVEATLTAPFDGVVTAVNVRPGENATGVVVELIDSDSLELALEVDEIDIAKLAPEQPATVTLETWPNETISAEVAAIVPQPVAGSDLVVYRVFLTLGETSLPARAGMTADATLNTGELADVLLLPSEAIQVNRSNGTYSVQRVATGPDGEELIETVEISIGRRSGRFTEITGGLQAGDQVIVSNAIPTQDLGSPDGGPQGGGGLFSGPGN